MFTVKTKQHTIGRLITTSIVYQCRTSPKSAVMICFTTVNEPLLDVCNSALYLENYLCS